MLDNYNKPNPKCTKLTLLNFELSKPLFSWLNVLINN